MPFPANDKSRIANGTPRASPSPLRVSRRTPETFDEWVVVMDKLCEDTERPSPPAIADALDRALFAMSKFTSYIPAL